MLFVDYPPRWGADQSRGTMPHVPGDAICTQKKAIAIAKAFGRGTISTHTCVRRGNSVGPP